jgi:hypothetical protein
MRNTQFVKKLLLDLNNPDEHRLRVSSSSICMLGVLVISSLAGWEFIHFPGI